MPALGSSVAIIGCGLGVLHARMAVLRACAPVIIIGDNRKRLHIAKEMGADYTIDIDEVADPVAEVMKLTGGRGVDYVIEAVGTVKTYEQAFAMLRKGGTLSAFGITGEQDTMKIRPFEFVLGEKKITGSCAGIGADWPDAITLLAQRSHRPETAVLDEGSAGRPGMGAARAAPRPQPVQDLRLPEVTKREAM